MAAHNDRDISIGTAVSELVVRLETITARVEERSLELRNLILAAQLAIFTDDKFGLLRTINLLSTSQHAPEAETV